VKNYYLRSLKFIENYNEAITCEVVATILLIQISPLSNEAFGMDDKNEQRYLGEPGHQLASETEDRFIGFLHKVIRLAVKVLAALMVAVIVWGVLAISWQHSVPFLLY